MRQIRGWHTVDERSPDVHPGEAEREAPEVSHRLAEGGAAYAERDDEDQRSERRPEAHEPGHGEPDSDERDERGGGD